MKDLPVLKYNALQDIMCLDNVCDLNGVVVDDKSLEVMLRIEKTMQRLEVMGSDDRRWLWIELKAPAKRYRDDDTDDNGNYWYQILSAHYKDFHYFNSSLKIQDMALRLSRAAKEFFENVIN